VQGVSARNFGLLIAYVLPGFVTLWGAGFVSPAVHLWLVGSTAGGPDVGGFLYTSIASVAVGMTVSAVRWATVDWLHATTGVMRPEWDDSKLSERLPAFEALVENHYRYYQFYANMLVALALAYPTWRISVGSGPFRPTDFGFLLVEGVFLAASRDALRRYYRRSAILLGTRERQVNHDERTRQRRRDYRCAARQARNTKGESGTHGGGARPSRASAPSETQD
jgi:hypothetical protein